MLMKMLYMDVCSFIHLYQEGINGHKWIKIQNIHLVDYYYTMKRTEILMYATTQIDSENE